MRPIRYLHALHAELVVMCKGKPKKSEAQVAAEMAAMGRVKKKVADKNGRMVWRWVSKEDVREDNATGPAPWQEPSTVVPTARPPEARPKKPPVGGRIGLLDKMSQVLGRREPLPEHQDAFRSALREGISRFVLDMDLEKARAVRQAVGAERFDRVLAELPAGRLRYLAGQWSPNGRKPPSSVKSAQVLERMLQAVSLPPNEPVAPQPPHHGDDLELLMQISKAARLQSPGSLAQVKFALAIGGAVENLFMAITLDEARHLYAVLGEDVLTSFTTVFHEPALQYLSMKWNPHRALTAGTSKGDLVRDLRALVEGSASPLPPTGRPVRHQRARLKLRRPWEESDASYT